MKRFVIARQSDHLKRIAFQHAMTFEEILEANPQLKERKEPDLLQAGDIVQVREKPKAKLEVRKGTSNRFVSDIPTNKVRVALVDDKGPIAGERVEVQAPTLGKPFPEETDGSGALELELPIYATTVNIFLPNRWVALRLEVGALDPVESQNGVRQRLANLGHPHHTLESAVASWQLSEATEATGEVDDPLRTMLNQESKG